MGQTRGAWSWEVGFTRPKCVGERKYVDRRCFGPRASESSRSTASAEAALREFRRLKTERKAQAEHAPDEGRQEAPCEGRFREQSGRWRLGRSIHSHFFSR